jgi:hypothetical protein
MRTLLASAGAACAAVVLLIEVAQVVDDGSFDDLGWLIDAQDSPMLFSLVAGSGLLCGLAMLFVACLMIAKVLLPEARSASPEGVDDSSMYAPLLVAVIALASVLCAAWVVGCAD